MVQLIRIPVDNTSLRAVERMLLCRDVFTSGFKDHIFNPYKAAAYLSAHYMHGTQFVFRYDRNIMSRLMELVQGKRPTDEHRIACGIQMLALVSEAVIEPNIGLYELASGTSSQDAQREIAMFRRLDNTNPQILANIATGLSNTIDKMDLGEGEVGPEAKAKFGAVLDHWRASYSACLKIAALELTQLVAEEKMFELLRWFEEDSCFLAPGIILANRYFAPNAARKGLFKGLRSKNRDQALKGICNAAWDLTFIYAWMDDLSIMHNSGRIVILASLDKALHSIARTMLVIGDDNDHAEVTHRLLEEEFLAAWGTERGRRILDAYLGTQARRDNHPEKCRELTFEYTKKVERELEEEIHRYKP